MNKKTITDISDFQVYYEDTDFSGFVYHANYLKYFERAREHLIGISALKELFNQGLHFVVKSANLHFKKPGHFGDIIQVKSTALITRSPLIPIHQCASIKDGIILVEGVIEIVLVNKENFPTRIDENILKIIGYRRDFI